MRTVRQILAGKPHQEVYWIEPELSTFEALQLMAAKDIGAVLVMKNGQLLGLITERDYARKIVLHGRASRNTPVGELMTTKLLVVDPEKTVEDCMALMTEHKVRHLPVMEGTRLLGLISIGDVVKNVILEYRYNLETLERYITGGQHGLGA